MKHSVLLDTSFFIRLLNDEDPLHLNALGYYKYFLENDIIMKFSTISVAEYCVLGEVENLPFLNLQILPFNLKDAEITGEISRIIFEANKVSQEKLMPRAIIPNDSKLFAQAHMDSSITYFVTSDKRSKNTFALLKKKFVPKFEIISIDVSHNIQFGILDL